jgi:hypothetical protein
MIQTLPIYTIVAKWRDALKDDAAINDFCQTNFGKTPVIFVGLDLENPPTLNDCPLIIIRPGMKDEGELDPFVYTLSIGWAVVNESKSVAGSVAEYAGIWQCDYLGQLIYSVLGEISSGNPVTHLTYDLNPIDYFPQFVGEMTLVTEVHPAIGGTITY